MRVIVAPRGEFVTLFLKSVPCPQFVNKLFIFLFFYTVIYARPRLIIKKIKYNKVNKILLQNEEKKWCAQHIYAKCQNNTKQGGRTKSK